MKEARRKKKKYTAHDSPYIYMYIYTLKADEFSVVEPSFITVQGHNYRGQEKMKGLPGARRKFLRVSNMFISWTVEILLWLCECQDAAIYSS